ncbi:hypothetical protein T12_2833 [Trichinella patagoniensis]|uniref:Uncharacterized protein n=1 Tax=Trichinella patagoniensis TaxID=990121 RepID=A0A0V0Z5Q4_9BILA|nr:hypothetical protein T12_2833 [Trichinella patagoniensis]
MYMYYYKFLQEVKWRLFNESASKHTHTRRLSPSRRSNHGSTPFLLLTTVPLPSSSDQQVPLTLGKFSKNVKDSLQFTIKFYKLYMLVVCLRKAFVEKMEKVIVNVQIRTDFPKRTSPAFSHLNEWLSLQEVPFVKYSIFINAWLIIFLNFMISHI